jgi:hypothetical protein
MSSRATLSAVLLMHEAALRLARLRAPLVIRFANMGPLLFGGSKLERPEEAP